MHFPTRGLSCRKSRGFYRLLDYRAKYIYGTILTGKSQISGHISGEIVRRSVQNKLAPI
jgi:hypothetical protein